MSPASPVLLLYAQECVRNMTAVLSAPRAASMRPKTPPTRLHLKKTSLHIHIHQLRCTMRTAGRLNTDLGLTERTVFCCRRFLRLFLHFRTHGIDHLYDQEDNQRHDNKINHIGYKRTVFNHGRSCRLGSLQRSVLLTVQGNKQIREINVPP